MTKKEKEVYGLELNLITSCRITCAICSKTKIEYSVDRMDFLSRLYDDGWRSINSKAACPKCSKKERCI